jgi:hypothetical protein
MVSYNVAGTKRGGGWTIIIILQKRIDRETAREEEVKEVFSSEPQQDTAIIITILVAKTWNGVEIVWDGGEERIVAVEIGSRYFPSPAPLRWILPDHGTQFFFLWLSDTIDALDSHLTIQGYSI